MNIEINKCLQQMNFLSNEILYETNSLFNWNTFQHQQYQKEKIFNFEEKNFKFEEIGKQNFNEHSQFNFSINDDNQNSFQYKQLSLEDEENNQNTIQQQEQEIIYKIRQPSMNFAQTLQKLRQQTQIQQKNDDPFEKFNSQFTSKNTVPALFLDEQQSVKQSIKRESYKPIRERIQERLEKQQKEEIQKPLQVINNRFTKASQSPASRYISKSPQSQFTKEFEKKFNQLNSQYNSQSTLQNYQPLSQKNSIHNNSGLAQTPKRQRVEQIETTTQIKIDIQNFQETQKKQFQENKQPENNQRIKKLKINSQDFQFNINNKVQQRDQSCHSKSPIRKFQTNICKTVQKENCKYLVINLYQKKL